MESSKKNVIRFEITLENGKNLRLPKREIECITYLFFGFDHMSIAERLGISARTVEFYLKNTKARLGSQSTIELKQQIFSSNFLEVLFKNT